MSISGRKTTVLVIDDDVVVADTLVMVLTFSGFEAIAAYSGETAVELARQSEFDNVVSDVMMQPMNGIQAALAISQLQPTCRILLISGHEHTAKLLQESIRSGHDFPIMAKPVHPTTLLEYLRASTQDSIIGLGTVTN
jgi:DNA-binding NtrC family response regulator